MSKNTENVRVHGPGHEKRDVNYHAVFIFGITLTLTLLAVSFGMRAVFGQFCQDPAARAADDALLHGPRATTGATVADPAETGFAVNARKKQQQLLNSYGWADQTTGKVRIPIDRAMDLVLQRGLPMRQPTGGGRGPGSAVQSANHRAHATAEQRKQQR